MSRMMRGNKPVRKAAELSLVQVEIRQGVADLVQEQAWARLWHLLLSDPQHNNAPEGATPRASEDPTNDGHYHTTPP
jgi:hypothetical protein